MKYTLIRDGEKKTLKAGSKIVATWDKHDSYEHCVAQAQVRMKDDDELVEKEGVDATPSSESAEAAEA